MSGHGVGGKDKSKRAERAKRALNAMKRATVTLSLKHFILKQRALSLYRTAIRASRGDRLASFFTLPHLPISSHSRLRDPKRNNIVDQSRIRKEQTHRRLGWSKYPFCHLPTHSSFPFPGHHRDQVESWPSGARTSFSLSFRTQSSVLSVLVI